MRFPFRPRRPPPARRCADCQHFTDGARALGALPGLGVLSSAQASVTDADGLCGRWGRFTGARDGCPAFHPVPAPRQ